jgi:DNA-binding IclR family transcriptional regulator
VRIQSLARADAILNVIARAPEGRARLTQISEAAALNKNTTFSLLETLTALGYLVQDRSNREYSIGWRLFEFAKASQSDLDVTRLARAVMFEIHGQTSESVSLAIPLPLDALIVSTLEGTYGVRGARNQGRHVAYHAAAVGKVMLAFFREEDREAVLNRLSLTKLTKNSITSAPQLSKELAAVRRRGFALSMEEEEMGANAVATPVLSSLGEVLGGIAVWGPPSRLTRSRLIEVGAELASSCRKLMVSATS